MKGLSTVVALQALLSTISGILLSQMSLIGKVGITTSGGKRAFMFVLNPSLARAFADAGYSRQQVREAIASRAFK